MKTTYKIMMNGIRAAALLMVMLICLLFLAPGARAQSDLYTLPLAFGTVTNTVYVTNLVYTSTGLTTNYLTNILINPNYTPTNQGASTYLYWGANVPANSGAIGAPASILNPYQGSAINNGWVHIPPNVDVTFGALLSQVGTTTAGLVGFGLDLSMDGIYGTTNAPVQFNLTNGAAGTNWCFSVLNRTNFLQCQYARLDLLTSGASLWVQVNTNEMFWRASGIKF